MCRFLAYHGAPIYLEDMIASPSHSLIAQSLHASEGKTEINGDGFGLGWYGEREYPGLFRDLRPAWSDENLRGICQQVAPGCSSRMSAPRPAVRRRGPTAIPSRPAATCSCTMARSAASTRSAGGSRR
jgi:hypothetical protein